MPKRKTHKGIKKRMKVTAKGKVKHGRAGKSHLMSSMRSKRKRRLRKKNVMTGSQAKTYRRLLQD